MGVMLNIPNKIEYNWASHLVLGVLVQYHRLLRPQFSTLLQLQLALLRKVHGPIPSR